MSGSLGALGGIAGGLLASSQARKNMPKGAPEIDLNRLFSAGASTLQGGNLNIDPAVGGVRDDFLSRLNQVSQPGGNFDFGSRFRGLGEEFAGNQGSLINARMNPLRQQVAQQGGALQRNLGRRGVQGTFANQAMTNFGMEAGRQLGDAQAMATNDAMGARTNLLGAEQGAESALTQLLAGSNQQLLSQELAKLGLGANSIMGLLGAQNTAASINAPLQQKQADLQNELFGGMLGSLGGAFSPSSAQSVTGSFG